MSISTQLTELVSNRDLIVSNLIKQGVQASSAETLKTLANKILEIKTGGGATTLEIFDCSSMTSSEEVVNKYASTTKVSNDGQYADFESLGDYVYNNISAVYTQNTAGISIKSGTNQCGFYFSTPFTITSSKVLMKHFYYVSTWINPTIVVNFIDASLDIEKAIADLNFVLSKSILLASSLNRVTYYTEIEGLSAGSYYMYVQIPSTTGGNEAVVSRLSLVCL